MELSIDIEREEKGLRESLLDWSQLGIRLMALEVGKG